jgi:hypothetical protein
LGRICIDRKELTTKIPGDNDMKKHLFAAGLLAGLVGLSALAAGQSQLDISLEGPWILFTDTMTAANGNDEPVVVAIAPTNAAAHDPTPNDPDSHFHHWPQMSSGNGYYLPSYGLFCLAFNSNPSATGKWCAPHPSNGATFSTGNGYTPERLLPLKGDIANKKWLSYGGSSDVIILPYPDFYRADGFWPIRFLDQSQHVSVDPDKYTIGLILHYSNAKSKIGLYSCTPSVQTKITTDDCKKEAADDDGHTIEVTNSGTLRLHMRAPDTTDDCDHHVRFAYHQALKLIDPTYSNGNNGNYRYIDPAQAMNADDSGVFDTDDCWAADQAARDQEDTSTGSKHPVETKQENPAKQSNPFMGTLNTIEAQWETLLHDPNVDPKLKDNEMFRTAHNNFEQAYKLRGSLLITDVQRMGALLSRSAQKIDSLLTELQTERSKTTTTQEQDDAISALVEIKKNEKAFADYTKNGADCRAAQVLVQ